jgi:hypothetical protein
MTSEKGEMNSPLPALCVFGILLVLAVTSVYMDSAASEGIKDIADTDTECAHDSLGLPNAIPLGMIPVDDGPGEYDTLISSGGIKWVFMKGRTSIIPWEDSELYRERDGFYMHNELEQQWFQIHLSKRASTIYPVGTDPVDTTLIWIGCNDGPKSLHADYVVLRPPPAHGEGALLQRGRVGGLAIVDTERRTISYFGASDLISNRVYEVIFDEYDSNSVWIWGRYPGAGDEEGIVRYDRRNRQFIRHVYGKTEGHDRWSRDTEIRVEEVDVVVSTGDQILRMNKATGAWEKE